MNAVHPKKLLNSKWTAAHPINRERHFLVTEVEFNEDGAIIHCLMEAVISRRSFPIQWRSLRDNSKWIIGWK